MRFRCFFKQNGASVFTCALYNDNISPTTRSFADECNAAGIADIGALVAVSENELKYDVIIDAVFGIRLSRRAGQCGKACICRRRKNLRSKGVA